MRIHRHIAELAATLAVIGAGTPVAGAVAAPNQAWGALAASVVRHPVSAPARTHSASARVVPEVVWREINDALQVKLLNRP